MVVVSKTKMGKHLFGVQKALHDVGITVGLGGDNYRTELLDLMIMSNQAVSDALANGHLKFMGDEHRKFIDIFGCMVESIEGSCEAKAIHKKWAKETGLKGIHCDKGTDNLMGSASCGINGLAASVHDMAVGMVGSEGKVGKCIIGAGAEKLVDDWVISGCESIFDYVEEKYGASQIVMQDRIQMKMGYHAMDIYPYSLSFDEDMPEGGDWRDVEINYKDYKAVRAENLKKALLSAGWEIMKGKEQTATTFWVKKTLKEPKEMGILTAMASSTKDGDFVEEGHEYLFKRIYREIQDLGTPIPSEKQPDLLICLKACNEGFPHHCSSASTLAELYQQKGCHKKGEWKPSTKKKFDAWKTKEGKK